MRPSSSTRLRRRARSVALSVATAGSLMASVAAVPAVQAAAPHGAAPRATSAGFSRPSSMRPEVVTLVTGDRVVVRRDASGRTVASLTPQSPHYGRPVEFVHTADHTWVVPKLPRAVRHKLASSVFDVAALSRSARVPLRVTFARGTAPRSVPGLAVHTATARGVAGGRTTVRASYDAHRPLPASFSSSLHGVARIALAEPAPAPPPAYELHTLTIDATNAKGNALPSSDVFVMNADDARLFGTLGGIVHGQWKVSVPAGNYFVVVSTFNRVVVHQVDVGDVDTETSLSMADATVRPKMQAPPGFKTLDPEFDVDGSDQAGTGDFGFGFSGAYPRVNPVTHVATGSLFSEISNLWAPKGYHPVTFHHNSIETHPIKRVVAAKQVRKGIPRHLSFAYHPKAYADVTIKHYATGQQESAFDAWVGFSPVDTGVFVQAFPSVRPGVIHASLLGSKDIVWDSSTTVNAEFNSFTELDQTAKYHAGQHAVVPFFRGPVAPVADRGGESGHVSYQCQLCVIHGTMGGQLAMMSSAGTDQFGFTDRGTFAVHRGRSLLAQGNTFLAPVVTGVKPGQRLRLDASTKPSDNKEILSSNVADSWTFAVPSGQRAIVPLLRAAYVPPTTMHSVGKAGTVSYPVTFDNLGPVDARVARASVRWSVDGRHWKAAHLTRTSKNTFRVSYRNPAATRAHRYLSLKVSATDTAGRTISETVEHAYALPHGSSRTSSTPRSAAPSHGASTNSVDRFHPGKLCRTTARHRYSCFVKLAAQTRSARRAAPDPAGWGAAALRSAYDIGAGSGTPDTIGIIDAFGYPHAEADMNKYRAQYGLPACTSASGCFQKVNQNGGTGRYPQTDYDWGVETALDLQMVSTACPTCHIVLVEADDPSDASFFKAEQTAVDAGALVTSHSFGRIELTGAETDALTFDHPGVTAVASTGDYGYGPAQFPASSPEVVAVGGTELARSSTDPRGWTEQAWSGASSGCSAYFPKPTGQPGTACHNRAIADVSAVASGLAVYDTSLPRKYRGWLTVDGTSASAPLVAGMIASVDGAGIRPADLYAESSDAFNDVVSGSNGYCQGNYICTGVPGYDGPTGLGSPSSPDAFDPPA